jgi:uncharacterized protein (TIGR01777 family)
VKVVAAGMSGFLGTRLTRALHEAGHKVVRLVRSDATGPDESLWNPHSADLDSSVFDGADAVVNLCGPLPGFHRWSEDYKHRMLTSRVNPTRVLAGECARLGIPVLINASAVGYYGARGAEIVTESAAPGDTFLANLCVHWEAAVAPARAADVRVVTLRTGLVLGMEGDLLRITSRLTRMGLGGRLGSGKQYWPWISGTDHIAAMMFLLTHPVDGPVNLTAPYPVTNEEFTEELGRALHRPAPWVAPEFAIRAALGEFADELVDGRRAVPAVLHENGFEFKHRTLREGLAAELIGRH